MADLELPEFIRPESMSMKLKSNTKANRSPWNQAVQTIGLGGSHWAIELTMGGLTDWESRQLESILYQLDGMSGRIWLGDYGRIGTMPKGEPVVFGVGQSGSTLQSAGWTPSQKVLERGSYLQVGDELKMITSDAWSDVNGRALIMIAPRWRRAPQNGAPIIVDKPRGLFLLDSNDNGPSRQPAFRNSMTLNFVEAIAS
ncbi:MAG: hypothetical protein ACRCT2_09790 [Plesiomonas shigelloides]